MAYLVLLLNPRAKYNHATKYWSKEINKNDIRNFWFPLKSNYMLLLSSSYKSDIRAGGGTGILD